MCLILFGYQAVPGIRMLILANRDEFYDRPSLPAHQWPSPSHIIAGKDLRSGGTWLGIDPRGRMAAITNYRQGMPNKANARSRGDIPIEFLTATCSAHDFIEQRRRDRESFGGYNLLLMDDSSAWHYCSALDQSRAIQPGVHGISNHSLDTPWPKILKGTQALSRQLSNSHLNTDDLLTIMRDDKPAALETLPETGVGLDWETTLSPIFINSETYGTRCTTLLIVRDEGQVEFTEVSYPPDAKSDESETRHFAYNVS